MKILARSIIRGAIGVTSVVLIAVVISYSFYRKSIEASEIMMKRQMVTIASQTAKSIEELFFDYKNEMDYLSKLPYVRNVREPDTTINLTIERKQKPYFYSIFKLDKNGICSYITPSNVLAGVKGKDFSFREYFKEAKKTGLPQVSELILVGGQYADVKDKFKAINVVAPVYDRSGKFDGLIGSNVNLDVITRRFVTPVKIGEKGYAFLLDGDGVTLAHPDASVVGVNITKRSDLAGIAEIIQTAMSTGMTQTGRYYYKNEEKLLAASPLKIDTRQWIVGVSLPYDDVRKIIYPIYSRLLILMLFVVGAVLGGGVVFVKKSAEVGRLKEKLVALEIQIDEEKKVKDVGAIMETDYFKKLLDEMDHIKNGENDRSG